MATKVAATLIGEALRAISLRCVVAIASMERHPPHQTHNANISEDHPQGVKAG
jgi:hypothetical protein